MLQRNRPCYWVNIDLKANNYTPRFYYYYWRNYMVYKEEGYFLFHTSDDFASLLCALPQYLLAAGQTPVHIASVFNCSVKDERLQPPDITRNVTEYLLARLWNIQNINNKKEFYACSFYSGQCSKNVLDKIIVVPPRNDLALIYVEIIFYIVAAAIVFKLFLLILRPPSRSTLTDVTTIEGQQVICLHQAFDTADAVKLFIYRCIQKKKCYQVLLLHFILLLGGMIPFLCSIFNIQKFRYIYTHLDLSTLLMILLYWLPSLVIFLIINLLLGMIVTVLAITLTRNKIARGCANYVKASNDWFATFVDQGFFYKIVHWFQLHIFIFVITFKANEFNIKSSRWYRYFLIIYFTMSLGLLCYELTNLCGSILANIIIGVVHPSGMLPLLATQLPFVVTLIALIQRHFNRKQYILGLFNELNAKDIPVCIETYRSDNQILVEVSPNANQFIHQIQDFFQQETFHKSVSKHYFIFNEKNSNKTISKLANIIEWKDVQSNFNIVESLKGRKWIRLSIYDSAAQLLHLPGVEQLLYNYLLVILLEIGYTVTIILIYHDLATSLGNIAVGILMPYVSLAIAVFFSRTSFDTTGDKRTICKAVAMNMK